MKFLSIATLVVLAIIPPANISLAQTTPPDTQSAAHSKQDAKATKQKPSAAAKTSPQTKSGASKKSTKGEDAAYASAYKAGAQEQNKGTAPK